MQTKKKVWNLHPAASYPAVVAAVICCWVEPASLQMSSFLPEALCWEVGLTHELWDPAGGWPSPSQLCAGLQRDAQMLPVPEALRGKFECQEWRPGGRRTEESGLRDNGECVGGRKRHQGPKDALAFACWGGRFCEFLTCHLSREFCHGGALDPKRHSGKENARSLSRCPVHLGAPSRNVDVTGNKATAGDMKRLEWGHVTQRSSREGGQGKCLWRWHWAGCGSI
jgi:hypothetical protein